MLDCDNNELKIGDRIAFQSVVYKYLHVTTIHSFTPKKVKIKIGSEFRTIDPERVAKVFIQNA